MLQVSFINLPRYTRMPVVTTPRCVEHQARASRSPRVMSRVIFVSFEALEVNARLLCSEDRVPLRRLARVGEEAGWPGTQCGSPFVGGITMQIGKRTAVMPKVPWAPVVLLTCSVGINLLLGLRVSKLEHGIESLEFGNGLYVGTTVPPIKGRLLGAHPGGLDFSRSKVPTLLYVFRPDCGWCEKNLSNLRALIAASGPRYRIVGLSLPSATSLNLYLQMTELRFPVYADVSEDSIEAYRLGGTPETILVSPQSKVLGSWIGAYRGPLLTDIENHLGVRLQECCQAVSSGS